MLAAYMRETFPISRPTEPKPPTSQRKRAAQRAKQAQKSHP